MTEFSPEAIAAYPYIPVGLGSEGQTGADAVTDMFRAAFDAGRAVTFAATREALAGTLSCVETGGDPMYRVDALKYADAILAPGGPIRDVREVKAEALEEAANAWENMPDDEPWNTCDTWLRARAAEIREGRA